MCLLPLSFKVVVVQGLKGAILADIVRSCSAYLVEGADLLQLCASVVEGVNGCGRGADQPGFFVLDASCVLWLLIQASGEYSITLSTLSETTRGVGGAPKKLHGKASHRNNRVY